MGGLKRIESKGQSRIGNPADPGQHPQHWGTAPALGMKGQGEEGCWKQTLRVRWRGPSYLGCALRPTPEDRETKHPTPDLPPSVLP